MIRGRAPVVTMRGYSSEVAAYARGRGRLSLTLKGYEPCHNAEEVIRERGYDPEQDAENPTGSVFCARGSGFYVPWDRVEKFMHLESVLKKEEKASAVQEQEDGLQRNRKEERRIAADKAFGREEKELERSLSAPTARESREQEPPPG